MTEGAQPKPWMLRHWRLSVLGAGLAAAAALPPVHAWPLLFPAFTLLAWLVGRTERRWRSFWLGFLFGFALHVGGLYWLAWPLTLDIARFGWMIPFAVFGISGGLAILTGLATLAVRLSLGPRPCGLAAIVCLAGFWALFEWARAYLFTGFPWNLLATIWTAEPAIVQAAAFTGPYLLGFITVLLATLPALAFRARTTREPGRRFAALAAGPALLGLIALAGWTRLPAGPTATVPDVRLRLVQGAVPQTLKWDPAAREANFALYLALSSRPPAGGAKPPTHLIWPETAIDYRFVTAYRAAFIDGERRQRLLSVIPEGGALLVGAIRDDGRHYYNSLHAVAKSGLLTGTYDKHHLVPFGEYVPLRGILRRLGVERLAHGRADYSPGPGPRTLEAPGVPPFGVHICYEAIFAHEAVGKRRPSWIVNITNDAWFGHTSGPYQHLAAARLRAVEQGLPVVRAANTGISAVIDPYGRIVARLPLDTRGAVDAPLPRALPATLYARFGGYSNILIVFIVVISIIGFKMHKAHAHQESF